MTHPSIRRAREMIERLKDNEALYAAEKAGRDFDQPDALEAWRATRHEPTVRELQASTEELDARISALRDELLTLINDSVAALRDELDALAEEIGSMTGKMQRQLDKIEKMLAEKSAPPRLVKSDAA